MSDHASESATQSSPHGDSGLGLTQVSQSNYVLPAVPLESVIEHLENGKLLTEIAPIYGVTPQAVGKYIRTKLGRDAYASVRETGTEVRLHKSREAISVADDQVSLARAREEFAADKWFAEREHPERWGQRTHVTHEDVTDLAAKLRRARERTIDGNGVVDITPVMSNAPASSGQDSDQ